MKDLKGPKVAIDARPLKGGDSIRGIGTYARELLAALKMEGVDVSKEALSKYDVVHFTSFKPFTISTPLFKPKNTNFVLTIYDLIPLIYPKHYPPGLKGKVKFLINKCLIKKNIDTIITISETSKKDIVRFLGIPAEKIFVIHLAADEIYRPLNYHPSLITHEYRLPARFVLYVGDVNYNKNILTLCKACKLAKISLVIVGKQATATDFDRTHPETQPLVKLLEQYGEDKDIIRLGFVPDEDLVAIYNLATLYCQPSYYEGFALPVLEAFACGVPVVASKIQAHVEIAGDACLYADPQNPRDFAKKISEVINDDELRKELIEKGKEKVKGYSWGKVANETADIYRKIAG